MGSLPVSKPALPHGTIFGLALTQLVGWGTTYYLPSVLAPSFRRDLDLSQEVVFGGITVMLLIGAAVAPFAGRLMERRGARGTLMAGSLLMALSLAIFSQAQGGWSYVAAWVVVGVASPLALTQGALSALAQVTGEGARRAISRLMLVSGFASTIFWPLTAWLDSAIGWRSTCLVYAGLNLLLCLPIHALVVPSLRAGFRPAKPATLSVSPTPLSKPPAEKTALVLSGLVFSLAGFVSSGLGVQMVDLLTALGHPTSLAVAAGALVGPAAAAARLGEATVGQRAGIMMVGIVALAAMPLALALPLFDSRSVALMGAFVIGYGMTSGAMTIVRSVMPLALFGRDRYIRLLGGFAVPQNVVFAISPMVFAGILGSFGPRAALLVGVASATLALAAIVILALVVRRAAKPD